GDLDLEIVEAIAGAGADPVDLALGLAGRARADAGRIDLAGGVVEVETDDVGLGAGDAEHAPRPTADHQRRTSRRWLGEALETDRMDVVAGDVDQAVAEARPQHPDRLDESIEPDSRAVERHPDR